MVRNEKKTHQCPHVYDQIFAKCYLFWLNFLKSESHTFIKFNPKISKPSNVDYNITYINVQHFSLQQFLKTGH